MLKDLIEQKLTDWRKLKVFERFEQDKEQAERMTSALEVMKPYLEPFLKESMTAAYDQALEDADKALPAEKAVCGCDEDLHPMAPGYHTKDCDMTPYGFNEAIQEAKQAISDLRQNHDTR